MAKKAKIYSSQEILNRAFTGTGLKSGGTPSSSAVGGSLSTVYSEQEIWNTVFDSTNNLIKFE